MRRVCRRMRRVCRCLRRVCRCLRRVRRRLRRIRGVRRRLRRVGHRSGRRGVRCRAKLHVPPADHVPHLYDPLPVLHAHPRQLPNGVAHEVLGLLTEGLDGHHVGDRDGRLLDQGRLRDLHDHLLRLGKDPRDVLVDVLRVRSGDLSHRVYHLHLRDLDNALFADGHGDLFDALLGLDAHHLRHLHRDPLYLRPWKLRDRLDGQHLWDLHGPLVRQGARHINDSLLDAQPELRHGFLHDLYSSLRDMAHNLPTLDLWHLDDPLLVDDVRHFDQLLDVLDLVLHHLLVDVVNLILRDLLHDLAYLHFGHLDRVFNYFWLRHFDDALLELYHGQRHALLDLLRLVPRHLA
mmetsp:Transcript_74859/g.207257  ORF Transcript_74859/g.207257 Transcript_74859/m.207257 type:complete len:348 (+) Transcript_74859:680-1723(+)